MGSPPRMRGKVTQQLPVVQQYGITPAYAGKRSWNVRDQTEKEDHPRVCGEKICGISLKCRSLGSPPRMRGKEQETKAHSQRPGITPAYAGKSSTRKWREERARDHPRVCGEKLYEEMERGAGKGSPPRMRGKARRWRWSWKITRITPAYAGKRIRRVKMPTPVRDHPRVCGEKSTVSPVAIVPLFPSVCNKPVVSDGSPAGRDAPLFLPAENAVPASPAYNLRSL